MNTDLGRKDLVVMKLLHYFMTEKNYTPIILQGAEDEIWLENLDGDYQIIRIVSNYLHNDEQYDFDRFRAKKISSKISKKVFTYNMNILNIYTDLGDNVHLTDIKKMDSIYIYEDTDIETNTLLNKVFPDIKDKVTFNEEGMELFVKITEDINKKNVVEQQKAEDIFKMKFPIITYILIALNILIFLIPNLMGNYEDILNKYCMYGEFVRKYGEYYRIITAGFLHGDIIHLALNMYALYVIGRQMESFLGKTKYITVYFVSLIMGSLLSMALSNYASVGASGAIFGLMGSMLYFGYHYRVYLGNVLKTQLIPLIFINLVYGFVATGIDNFGHIGGLIGGVLATKAVGVKYKSTKSDIINGIIMLGILLAFLIYMGLIKR
jgi:rhomboid protease GluP